MITKKDPDEFIEHLRKTLPCFIKRKNISNLLFGIISSKTLANMDSSGEGPPRMKSGRDVFYHRDLFLAWLAKRIKKVEP